MERTASGRWKAFRKRLSNLFRRLGASTTADGKTSSATDAGRRHRPNNGGTSATAPRFNKWSGDDGQGMAGLRLERANLLYAELRRKNEQTVVRLFDTTHENFRLSKAAGELEAKLREVTARAEKLEAERLASSAAAREQAATTNSSIAGNSRLNAALSESSRRTEAAERRAVTAGRRAETAKSQAVAAKRRAVEAKSRAVSAERRAVAAERRAEAARRPAERTAEQLPVLSSAVADLRGVLSSPLADLRIVVLRTAVETLRRALEAKADDGTGPDLCHYDGDDEHDTCETATSLPISRRTDVG